MRLHKRHEAKNRTGKALLLCLGGISLLAACAHAPPPVAPVEAPVYQAAAKGAAFLLARQDGDGAWRDYRIGRVGVSDQWVSAYVGESLARACPLLAKKARADCRSAVERAKTYLRANRFPAGGWGYNQAAGMDADSTAIALEFLGDEDTAPLERFRRGDGGYATYDTHDAWGTSHVSVTAQVLAVKADRRALGFLRARMRPDGCWDDYWWVGKLYPTERAVNAFKGHGIDLFQVRDCIQRSEHPHGGWGKPGAAEPDAFETALAILTLLQLGGGEEMVDRGMAWLLKTQRAEGSWSPSALLRIPRRNVLRPWEGRYTGMTGMDERGLFTTATVLRALTQTSEAKGGP